MKIIDLLNKIAKGEEVPKRIKKHWEYEYKYDELRDEYCYMDHENKRFDEKWLIFSMINDEVEVMDNEEEKEIEKLDVALLGQCDNWLQDQVTGEKSRLELNPYIINNIRENTLYFQKKINQIIDLINDMRDKE